MEIRINSKTSKPEVKLEPEGLPPIWVPVFCDRCEKFNECLSFNNLSIKEWESLNRFIQTCNLNFTHSTKYFINNVNI